MSTSLVRRQCRSQKECSDCQKEIAIGEWYYGNPNKSLCESCAKIELAKVDVETSEVKLTDIEAPVITELKNKGYPVNAKCKYCDDKQEGEIRGIPICLLHVDDAVAETV